MPGCRLTRHDAAHCVTGARPPPVFGGNFYIRIAVAGFHGSGRQVAFPRSLPGYDNVCYFFLILRYTFFSFIIYRLACVIGIVLVNFVFSEEDRYFRRKKNNMERSQHPVTILSTDIFCCVTIAVTMNRPVATLRFSSHLQITYK